MDSSRFNISLVVIDTVGSGYGVNNRVTSWKLRLSRIQSLIILLETVNSAVNTCSSNERTCRFYFHLLQTLYKCPPICLCNKNYFACTREKPRQ